MLESNLAEHGCASITRNKYHHHQQHDSTIINLLHIHLTPVCATAHHSKHLLHRHQILNFDLLLSHLAHPV